MTGKKTDAERLAEDLARDREAIQREVAELKKSFQPHASHTVRLSLDASVFHSALAELSQRLPELHQGLGGLVESGEQLFTLKSDLNPAGASEVIVRLEPGDGLRRLMTAGGTGN